MTDPKFKIGDTVKILPVNTENIQDDLYGSIRWRTFVETEDQAQMFKCPRGTFFYAIDIENHRGDFLAEEKFLEKSDIPLKTSKYNFGEYVEISSSFFTQRKNERVVPIVGITYVESFALAKEYDVAIGTFTYNVEFEDGSSLIVPEKYLNPMNVEKTR